MYIKQAGWSLLIVVLLITGVIPAAAQNAGEESAPVIVRFIGHASFMIVAPDGTRLVVDPYDGLSYPFPTGVEADAVVLSHTQHGDHANYRAIEGDPLVIKRPDLEPQTVGMIDITAHIGKHGLWNGQSMGANSVLVFQIGDVKLVHLGETGPLDDPAVLEAISNADVVFVPVGAAASIAPEEVMPLMDTIQARTIVPQHYAPDADHRYYDALTVEEFLDAAQPDLPVVEVGDLTVTPGMPPQIAVMDMWGFSHEAWEPVPVGAPAEDNTTSAAIEPVQIEFLGRSSFLITAPDGYRFVTDPYYGLSYDFPTGIEADAVVISHTHHDHSAYWLVEGNPTLVMEHDPVIFGMTTITGYPSEHGEYGDGTTGPNTVYVFEIGDVKLVHLGDFGSLTTEEGVTAVQDADVVFMPVGVVAGLPYYELFSFLDEIGARTRIPMHWFDPADGFGSTLTTFKAIVMDDPSYSELDSLEVTPGMPEQIVLLAMQAGSD